MDQQHGVLRIATRSSQLALWQAETVARMLQESCGNQCELIPVSTLGDRNRRESLANFGGMGVFTREVQAAVLAGDADLAVHSLKDLPTETNPGLFLAAFPARGSRYDLLVLPEDGRLSCQASLSSLPEGARVGTGSPRRQAQIRRIRPDLQVMEIRGNLDTRLRKLNDNEYDAIVLAEAGVTRLGWKLPFASQLAPPDFYPAVGQGALGVECRADDEVARQALATIDVPAIREEVTAERAALRELRAGCHAPLGALCQATDGELSLTVVVFSADGRDSSQAQGTKRVGEAAELGVMVAREIIAEGGAKLLGGGAAE